MDCRLTFKKAFGLTAMTPEEFFWLLEFQSSTFRVKSRDLLFHVSAGRMGETEQEKLAIMPFLHSDERRPEFINPILTLNLTTQLELEIPASAYTSWRTPSVVDTIVEPFIDSAFTAYQNFAEAYRDTKYLTDRGTQRWHEQHGVFVRLPAWNDFKTYLFYVLDAPDAVTFVGSFSLGRLLSIEPTDTALHERIQETLDKRVPLSRVLVVNAWEALFAGDLRSSVISAATALEQILSELIKTELTKRESSSSRQIERFVDEMSNRFRATIMLKLFDLGDDQLRAQAVDVFKIRNALIHQRKRYAFYKEAKSAVEAAEAFLLLAEGRNVEFDEVSGGR
jgi:hypothetical protein